MKKELSIYEFAGILVPNAILLYASQLIIEHIYKESFL
jgi:hypothetical protein